MRTGIKHIRFKTVLYGDVLPTNRNNSQIFWSNFSCITLNTVIKKSFIYRETVLRHIICHHNNTQKYNRECSNKRSSTIANENTSLNKRRAVRSWDLGLDRPKRIEKRKLVANLIAAMVKKKYNLPFSNTWVVREAKKTYQKFTYDKFAERPYNEIPSNGGTSDEKRNYSSDGDGVRIEKQQPFCYI